MSNSIIYNKFRYTNLKKFMESLLGVDSIYIGIGRPYPWDPVAASDVTIGTSINTMVDEVKDWEDMMHLKRLNYSDAAFGLRKNIWQAGQKYDTYRGDWDGVSRVSVYDGISYPTCVSDSKCMVLNANYDWYVCIKQPVSGVYSTGNVQQSLYSPETGTPIGTNTGILKTADGYYWKFIGRTSTNDYTKFSSSSLHPIRTLTASPGPTDYYYSQWQAQVQSQNFNGGIYCINVVSSGSGYSHWNGSQVVTGAGSYSVTDAAADSYFKIVGDGQGLQFNVTYGSGGSIADIEITNPGHGYSYAAVIPVSGVGAAFDIIFTPKTGLGWDPAKDFDSTFLLLAVTLDRSEGGTFTVNNEYRKVSLISNPFNYGTTTIATDSILDATTTLNLSSVVGGVNAFSPDGIVTGATSHAKGRTVDWDAVSGKLRIIRTRYDGYTNYDYASTAFINSDVVTTTEGSIGSQGTIDNITPPAVQAYSGDILYSEYKKPTPRDSTQAEVIYVIIQF